MTDRLEWQNRHFVLLKEDTVRGAAEAEKYPVRADLEGIAEAHPDAAGYIAALKEKGLCREASEFLAYTLHRRAAVWWAYLCVLTLRDEIEESPAEEIDFENIGRLRPLRVPDWAKAPPIDEAKIAEVKASALREKAKFDGIISEINSHIPPEVMKRMDEVLDIVRSEFKQQYGIDDIFKFIEEKAAQVPPDSLIDVKNSPITKAVEDLKQQLEAKRVEILDTVKAAVPPKVPAFEARKKNEALDAVWRWICIPNEESARAALEAGNASPQTPEGMLSYSSFWSLGNLDTTGSYFIPTPAGLAGNGISGTLLLCALAKGGTRKFKERAALYLDIGLEVAWGRCVWDKAATLPEPPHKTEGWIGRLLEELFGAASAGGGPDVETTPEGRFVSRPARRPGRRE